MIEVRRKIQLAIAHPILGPVVIVALAFLLALVFIHVVFNDAGFVADVGAICFGVVSALAAILVRRLQPATPLLVLGRVQERGPPQVAGRSSRVTRFQRTADFVLPLRR